MCVWHQTFTCGLKKQRGEGPSHREIGNVEGMKFGASHAAEGDGLNRWMELFDGGLRDDIVFSRNLADRHSRVRGHHTRSNDGERHTMQSSAPDPHHLVPSGTPHSRAIAGPIYGVHLVAMAAQIFVEGAGAHVPHFDRGILAAADEQSAVGAPGTLVYGCDVAGQCSKYIVS